MACVIFPARAGISTGGKEGRMYRICPWCGAYLDPGEICDCKKEAAPDVEDPEAALMKTIKATLPNINEKVKED